MIHVIDDHLAAANRPLLQSMFADRKRLFVDLFGWDVPASILIRRKRGLKAALPVSA